jgi:hypothetical protein
MFSPAMDAEGPLVAPEGAANLGIAWMAATAIKPVRSVASAHTISPCSSVA